MSPPSQRDVLFEHSEKFQQFTVTMEFPPTMKFEKFFTEEAVRCEKLRAAVRFCFLCRSREIDSLSEEDFVAVSRLSVTVIL